MKSFSFGILFVCQTGVPENRTSLHITAHHTAHHHTSTAHHQKSRYRGINANADTTLAFWKMKTTLSATVYDYFGVITRLTV